MAEYVKLSDRIMLPDTIQYYPTHLRIMREFKAISKSYDYLLRLLYQAMDKQEADSFLLTLTDDGCKIYERLLGLTVEGWEDLELRRKNIIAAQFAQPPYTENRLRETLTALCGEGNFSVAVDRKKQRIQIKVRAMKEEERNMLVREVEDLAGKWVPMNMIRDVSAFEYYNMPLASYAAVAVATHQRYTVTVGG